MKTKVYFDHNADIELIRSLNVGIIGFGSQGRAQALNLKDSGVNVRIGLRSASDSRHIAENLGFGIGDIKNIVKWADIISILIPDQSMKEVYDNDIVPTLTPGKTLLFSHGYNIHYGLITPPVDVNVVMVAPSGPGIMVRDAFLNGAGVPALIAVECDNNANSLAIALSYASAIGCTKRGCIQSTFREETETDLFGEQVVLCGGIPRLIQSAFNTLVEDGYPPIIAWFVCFYEVKHIVSLFEEKGFGLMSDAISDTAEFGGYTRGDRLVNLYTKNEMKKILNEIQTAEFHKEWHRENQRGLTELHSLRSKVKSSLIEKVGDYVRKNILTRNES